MFQNLITLPSTTQFVATTPVATFLERTTVTTLPPNVAPRILGYSYNSLGTAATVTLRLSPATGSAVNLQIDLETPTSAVNSFTHMCGRDGFVVPREFGLQNNGTTQVIDQTFGAPNNATPLVMLFTTTSKDNSGTFRVWWDYIELGGSGGN